MPATRWSSQFSDPQWIQVDLGTRATIDEVRLNWETALRQSVRRAGLGQRHHMDHDLQHGNRAGRRAGAPGHRCRPVRAAQPHHPGHPVGLLAVGVPGLRHYLRRWVAQRKPCCRSEKPAPRRRSRTRAPVSAVSRRTPSTSTRPPGGRPARFNGWVDPGWISVDLGAPRRSPRSFSSGTRRSRPLTRSRFPTTNVNWRTIFSTTTGHGFKETLTVSGAGRFVRMFGTARSNGFGYSLWEFQVYGTGGNPTPPPPPPPAPHFPGTLVWSDEFKRCQRVHSGQ